MEGQPSRLNYIGSKYTLLEWLESTILAKTGWGSLAGHRIADLFAGTGIVSYFLRQRGAIPFSNDVEPYAATITAAFVQATYTPALAAQIAALNEELDRGLHAETAGYMTRNYAPAEGCERMYFTVDNARRIDYIRGRLEDLRASQALAPADATFLLASLLTSADAVANVASTYGCYLKSYKKTAQRPLVLKPVHQWSSPSHPDSVSLNYDVMALVSATAVNAVATPSIEAVYLDPPYNERQYSKNYFPLNAIVWSPAQAAAQPALKGKTGIPVACFNSPFCRKREVGAALEGLVQGLRADWIFLSYSNESLLTRTEVEEILGRYGEVSLVSRPHKRFKAYEYNETASTEEYLFCLKRSVCSTTDEATTP